MTKRAVALSPARDRFIDEQVAAGSYPDADAVVAAALDRLADDAEIEAEKEARFQRLIQEGIDDLDAGRYETVTDLKAFFDELEAEVEAEFNERPA